MRLNLPTMPVGPLPRIFFDTNKGSHEGGYWLILDRSKKDLAAFGERLRDGEAVLICMPNDLEMVPRLRFEHADDPWDRTG